jgi:hypothetical protein
VPSSKITLLAVLLASAVMMVYVLVRFHQVVVRGTALLVLLLTPFLLFTFYRAGSSLLWPWQGARAQTNDASPDSPRSVKPHRAARVVWIIFDELDERMLFVARPASLKLPEFDRLRTQSFFASNAHSPARDTELSIPALLTGRLVVRAQATAPNELTLTFPDSPDALPWSTQPNVFSDAGKEGFRSGLAGWHHGYCRVIGQDIDRCRDLRRELEATENVPDAMREASIDLLNAVPFGYRLLGQRKEFKDHARRCQLVLEDAKQLLADENLNLLFLHFPVPHPPGIFNRFTGQISLDGKRSYLDNLALADQSLGDLRRSMESAGTWADTTVVVSSDHWWRTDAWSRNPLWQQEEAATAPTNPDHRIPFLVKLAGNRDHLQYDSDFNTVLTRELVLALLRGEVTGLNDLTVWLDQHRTFGDSPYDLDSPSL